MRESTNVTSRGLAMLALGSMMLGLGAGLQRRGRAQRRAIVILANGETTPGEQIRALIKRVLAGEAYVLPKPPAASRLMRRLLGAAGRGT